MRLENITAIEKSRGKHLIEFGDGRTLKVTAEQIADFKLYRGRELSDEEYSDLQASTELSNSKARALRILGNRNMSSRKMEKRLIEKGESAEIAEETVKWLEKIGVINDEEYAEMIVRSYSGKGYGIARIKDELYKRGIDRDEWDAALAHHTGGVDSALAVLRKKLGGSDDKDAVRKASGLLYRRGFKNDEIRDAIRQYIEEVEENGDEQCQDE